MRFFKFFGLMLFALFGLPVHADEVSGTWRRDKSAEYFGSNEDIIKNKYDDLKIVNESMMLGACKGTLEQKEYRFDIAFQGLIKERQSSQMVYSFMRRRLGIDMSQLKTYYTFRDSDCTLPSGSIFVSGDRLALIQASSIFYAYTRVKQDAKPGERVNTISLSQKLSRLPLDTTAFFETCAERIKWIKGVPQATDKCGPAYFPYIATKTDTDPLVRLIGTHRFVKDPSSPYAYYDNPFANGLHPLFMIFTPLKDVLLVRVDDFDKIVNEERERFGGSYLAIKNGKITDQLDDGCTMNLEYTCLDMRGNKQYQLLESGKFKKF
ncbi:hypothetical protein LXA47_15820 [Massilia sp. P8910]|uniref:hypothetical protein n=1 Tax=Massilia antarctica TaxID=2765360 RepID=UPI001E49E9BF|nr:hypothetical protein [Massilia antarctica]MCE3605070.1 hypothetical protein [Massilia antarctica]